MSRDFLFTLIQGLFTFAVNKNDNETDDDNQDGKPDQDSRQDQSARQHEFIVTWKQNRIWRQSIITVISPISFLFPLFSVLTSISQVVPIFCFCVKPLREPRRNSSNIDWHGICYVSDIQRRI